jgi:hypothetical protein
MSLKRLLNYSAASVFLAASAPSFAAVPEAVTTAITGAGTDAGTVGAAVLVVIVAIFAFKLMRKAL